MGGVEVEGRVKGGERGKRERKRGREGGKKDGENKGERKGGSRERKQGVRKEEEGSLLYVWCIAYRFFDDNLQPLAAS